MAEMKKGVTVHTTKGSYLVEHAFAEATYIEVRDGHLYVKNYESDILAIYSPGKWLNAEMTGTMTVSG